MNIDQIIMFISRHVDYPQTLIICEIEGPSASDLGILSCAELALN